MKKEIKTLDTIFPDYFHGNRGQFKGQAITKNMINLKNLKK